MALGQAAELTDRLKRRVAGQHPTWPVTPGRLRKAWIREQLATWETLAVFLQAAGLRSMRAVTDLQAVCPAPPTDPARQAVLLGGVGAHG